MHYEAVAVKLVSPEARLVNTDTISVSAYNTRHKAEVGDLHLDSLVKGIADNGFHPGKALHINLNGEKHELAAGLRRLLAAKQLNYDTIPCYVYKDLTPEEQVYLDSWDNRTDELHKPYHFLQEGEHYLFLFNQGWSYKTIAQLKGKSKATVCRRIKIAKLPEEAKAIIRDSLQYPVTIFEERNFQLICALDDPGMITVACKKIYETGKQAAGGTGRKLAHGQIAELVNAIKTGSGQNEYRQQELGFNLEQLRGKGRCMVPVWILELILHPGLNRYERDFISYLVKELYGRDAGNDKLLYEVEQIKRVTKIPAKNIPFVVASLKAKGIIVQEGNSLSIPDIDDPHKPETKQAQEPGVCRAFEEQVNISHTTIETELKKLGITDKNFEPCLYAVKEKGGLDYLKAQVQYCTNKSKQLDRDYGYYIAAIKKNYAQFYPGTGNHKNNKQTKPAGDTMHKANEKPAAPDNPNSGKQEVKIDQESDPYNEYYKFIDFEINKRISCLSREAITDLNNALIKEAVSRQSGILSASQKKGLSELIEYRKKTGASENELPFYRYLLAKLYIAHFQLIRFEDWQQGLAAG